MTGPAFQNALPRTSGLPLVNLRWPQRHLRVLYSWVRPDLDVPWGQGLGRSGPANGHRRSLPEGASRFIAGRHRSWAIDQIWVVDHKRAGLAISDPHWLSTLKFWGWEPLPTPRMGHEYTVYRLQNFWAHITDLLCRSTGSVTPTGTLLPSDGLKGRRYFGLSMAPARPWMRRRWYRLQMTPVAPETYLPFFR